MLQYLYAREETGLIWSTGLPRIIPLSLHGFIYSKHNSCHIFKSYGPAHNRQRSVSPTQALGLGPGKLRKLAYEKGVAFILT